MSGNTTGTDEERHAAELERLAQQLRGLRPESALVDLTDPQVAAPAGVGPGAALRSTSGRRSSAPRAAGMATGRAAVANRAAAGDDTVARSSRGGAATRSTSRPSGVAPAERNTTARSGARRGQLGVPELATVLPFRRPGSPAVGDGDGVSSPTRRSGASGDGSRGQRQSYADRQERKAAARVAAAEVFAAQLANDPEETARELCLGWLAVRPHTRAELAAKLKRKGVPAEAVGDVLDRYGEVGLIDDAAFAAAWVQSRHLGRGLAKRALAYELRARGIDSATVEAAVEQLDPEDEAVKARALVTRRLASMGHVPPEARARRLMGMLARKGYPGGMAATIVREVIAGSGVEIPDADLD